MRPTAGGVGSTQRATRRSHRRNRTSLLPRRRCRGMAGVARRLLTAAEAQPEYDVFGGPIRARLEGRTSTPAARAATRHHARPRSRRPRRRVRVGRNLTLRRRALERAGGFDPEPRPLRRRGGLAAAPQGRGRAHPLCRRRRGRPPPQRRGCARPRTRARRLRAGAQLARYDARKGVAPPVTAELRTLAGCLWHTVRRRCGNGIVMTALTLGRLREALLPKPVLGSTRDPDYLSGRSGTLGRRGLLAGRLRDLRANAGTARTRRRLAKRALGEPKRRVLVLSVVRPQNAPAIADWAPARRLPPRRAAAARRPGRGCRQVDQPQRGVDGHPLRGFDWLLIVDDDVRLPRDFLDVFISLAEHHDFRLAQPAHAFASHAAWEVTRRRPGLTARRTRFVEIGRRRRSAPTPSTPSCHSPTSRWGGASTPIGARSPPARLEDRDHRRAACPPHAAGRRRVPARGRDGRGRPLLDGRPYVTREQAAEVLEEYRD